jgi:hypothetical protein
MWLECVAISAANNGNIALSIYPDGVWLSVGFRIAAASAL